MRRHELWRGKSLRECQAPFEEPRIGGKPPAPEHFAFSGRSKTQSALALSVFHRFGAPQKELGTQTGFLSTKARGVEKGATKNDTETAIPTSN